MHTQHKLLVLTLALAGIGSAYAGGGEPAGSTPSGSDSESPTTDTGSSGGVNHTLAFDSDPLARQIVTGSKSFNGQTDRIFRDALGREAHFRGFNVSGEVKLNESGFKPFKNTADAKASFDKLGQKTGSNMVRFTIGWEGVHTGPGVIDNAYMAAIVVQMKEAIRNRMYILVDYHSDLYSRHTFTPSSSTTGNGAPGWIVNGGNHGTDSCGLPCQITWSAHKQSDPAVRSAMRAFWLNSDVNTSAGTRQVQTEFVWQLGEVASYIKNNLTAAEFDYVLGFDPINEPFDGGISELGIDTYKQFDNQLLWPFYERVRTEMDNHGWGAKWVYAEPMVFWNSKVGILAPATGGGHLDYKPGSGFIFNSHFYDQGRQGINNLSVARNGEYFPNLDEIRDEARFLDIPVFLSEFGMPVGGFGHNDNSRIVNGTYQGMEVSDRNHGKDRFADFYTPQVSGTQWQWDYYYDNHNEIVNNNPDRVETATDAWNGENYSVINNYGDGYNVNVNMVERSWPRRAQGDIMNFHYNALVKDQDNALLNWGAIRLNLGNLFENREYFRGKKFGLLTWRGRQADAPTEIFLPRHVDTSKLLVVTESVIKNRSLSVSGTPANEQNEVMLTADPGKIAGAGHRLLVWDDADAGEDANTIHFALWVEDAQNLDAADLTDLQSALKQVIQTEKRNPVYLAGQMSHGGYPGDEGDNTYFSLVDQRSGRCLDVAGARTGNGTNIQLYQCNDSDAQKWFYEKASGMLKSKLNWNKCLDVAGGNFSNGGNLQLWDCVASTNNQKFDFVGNSIRPRVNHNLAADATGTGNDANIVLWSVHGGANQQWKRRY